MMLATITAWYGSSFLRCAVFANCSSAAALAYCAVISRRIVYAVAPFGMSYVPG